MAMIVTLRNEKCFKFEECASGLYYYDTAKHDDDKEINDTHKTKETINPYYMLQTANNNKE